MSDQYRASGDDAIVDAGWDGSDEELAELAMSFDSSAPLSPEAQPCTAFSSGTSVLPDWYMPAVVAASHRRSTRVIVASIIAGFVVINACGLCITSGFLSWA